MELLRDVNPVVLKTPQIPALYLVSSHIVNSIGVLTHKTPILSDRQMVRRSLGFMLRPWRAIHGKPARIKSIAAA